MRRTSPVRLLIALIAAAASLTACGDDGDEPTRPTDDTAPVGTDAPEPTDPPAEPDPTPEPEPEDAIEVTVAGGSVDGPDRVEVATGDEVTARVTSDVADEIHVHGIDVFFDVAAGETTTITFTADIPGVYEVELESSGILLFELAVN